MLRSLYLVLIYSLYMQGLERLNAPRYVTSISNCSH
jgi:hypothetical protein